MSIRRIGVSASLWSADLGNLRDELRAVEPYCDSFHFDVMDGHYVPNLLFGPDQVQTLRASTGKPFQLHLMVQHPERLLPLFLESGDTFILHRETCPDWRGLAKDLRAAGKGVGVALRLDEEWHDLLDDVHQLDVIVLMGTEIGIKGASLSPGVLATIRELKVRLAELGAAPALQADGGIRTETVPQLLDAGADAITAGSLLFQADRPAFQNWLGSLRRRP